MADKKESRAEAPVSAPVTYKGDSIQSKLLLIGVVCICFGLVPMAFRSVKTFIFGAPAVAVSYPEICKDKNMVKLTHSHLSEEIVISRCMSGLILPILGDGFSVFVDAPGAVNICLWNDNRCVGVIKTENVNSQMRYRGEIPRFTAIRVWGDPGPATVYMAKTPRP